MLIKKYLGTSSTVIGKTAVWLEERALQTAAKGRNIVGG